MITEIIKSSELANRQVREWKVDVQELVLLVLVRLW